MERENTILSYEEFKEALKMQLSEKIPNVSFREHDVLKNNGQHLEGMTITISNSNIAPTHYPERLYEDYKSGVSIEEMSEKMAHNLKSQFFEMPQMPIFTREQAQEHIIFRLVNTAMNKEMLETCPHKEIEGTDLSAVPRWIVSDDAEGNASFLVTNNLLSKLKMTKEEVLKVAEENTKNMDFSCVNMAELMRQMMIDDGVPAEFIDQMVPDENIPIYVVTTDNKLDGAVSITSDKTMQMVSEKIDDNFYVLPLSRHEIICVPASQFSDFKELKAMVEEVNTTQVSRDDFLSDNVFHYDAMKHEIHLCSDSISFDKLESSNLGMEGHKMGGMKL